MSSPKVKSDQSTQNFPKISIVIPSLNKGRYIGKTLNSIFSQKYKNFEVIIQDGGSSDGTLEIIKKFVRKFPTQIFWESKEDKGQVEAINKGLEKARWEIVTFINADDVYVKDAFAIVAETFTKNKNCLWVAGRSGLIDKRGSKIDSKFPFSLVGKYKDILLSINKLAFLFCVNYLMQPSVFLAREAYTKFGPFTGTRDFVLEYDLWLKIAKVKMPFVLNKRLAYFRMVEENISLSNYQTLLKADYRIICKHAQNPLFKLIHKLNNWGRIVLFTSFKFRLQGI